MNAIAYAHYRLRGGMRNMLATSAGYAILAIAVTVLALSLVHPRERPQAERGLLAGMMAIQALIVVVYGFYTVAAAVRLDGSTMMDSHRMMPLADFPAVCGYLFGPTCQAIALFATNLLVGLTLCAVSNIHAEKWLLSNAVVAAFAFFVWCFTIFVGLTGNSGGKNAAGAVFALGGMAGAAVRLLPGVSVMGSLFIGETIFPVGQVKSPGWPHAFSAAVQLAMAAVFLLAAARRYRHPLRPGLNVDLGLILLTILTVASAVGLYYWEDFCFVELRYARGRNFAEGQLASSVIALMLVALLPVSNSARAAVAYLSTKQSKPLYARPAAICALATVAILVILFSCRTSLEQGAGTAVVVLVFLLSTSYLLRWTYLAVPRAGVILFMWILLTWMAPIVADVIRYNFFIENSDRALGEISTISPLGALIKLWTDPEVPARQGIGLQILLATVPAILFFTAKAKRLQRIAETSAAVSSS